MRTRTPSPTFFSAERDFLVVAGVGLRPWKPLRTADGGRGTPPWLLGGKKWKPNVGAAVARMATDAGWDCAVLGPDAGHARAVASACGARAWAKFSPDARGLEAQARRAAAAARKLARGRRIHLAYYGGFGLSKVKLPGDTCFLGPYDIPPEAVGPLAGAHVAPLLALLRAFRADFAAQDATKVVAVTALTSLRTKTEHALDAACKQALHGALRSIALDLTPQRVYVSEVMPGITDTGFYDTPATRRAIVRSALHLGYDYAAGIPALDPSHVAGAVRFALESPFHLREVSFVPFGQYPHLGA